MSFSGDVWIKLASIDVSKKVKKKGGFSYLSWAWAWGVLMENYPDSSYSFKEPVFMSDGSCEVWVDVTICLGENSLTRTMWLPALDFRNKAIKNPSAMDINTARMRCLTKCLAMFGLGHYIYAGEDLPDSGVVDRSIAFDKSSSIECIKLGIQNEDLYQAAEAWDELTKEEKKSLWPSFTGREQEVIGSEEFKECRK